MAKRCELARVLRVYVFPGRRQVRYCTLAAIRLLFVLTLYVVRTFRLSRTQIMAISHKRPMTRTWSSHEDSAPGAGQAYFSLIMPSSVSARVWSAISASPSVVIAGEEEWQTLRIKQGAISHTLACSWKLFCVLGVHGVRGTFCRMLRCSLGSTPFVRFLVVLETLKRWVRLLLVHPSIWSLPKPYVSRWQAAWRVSALAN